MTVYDQLSSRIGQRGDQADIDLAITLSQNPDPEAVSELVQGLKSKDPALQSDCVKALYELGYRDPVQIAPYARNFLELLHSRNNRLVWGGMIALSTIADQTADQLYPELERILNAFKNGGTITKDAGVSVLAGIASSSTQCRHDILPVLENHLKNCRPHSLAQHAERAAVAFRGQEAITFLALLSDRLSDLNPTQAKRVQRLMKQVEKEDVRHV